jgi:hypothetical protein
MSDEITLYGGSAEYVYVPVTGFAVNGVTSDPTDFSVEMALVSAYADVEDAVWVTGEWVTVDGDDCARALIDDPEPGYFWLMTRLTGGLETIIRKVDEVRVLP